MRRLLGAFLLLILAPGIGSAQNSKQERNAWGYPFFAIGGSSGGTATLHFGGGAEGLAYKGLGIGVEVGYLSPARELRAGVGTFSANGSYHFVRSGSTQKVVPFLTCGYSLAFREGSAHGANFGAGVQIWTGERVGLRLEFRDNYFSSPLRHVYGFRIAPVFR